MNKKKYFPLIILELKGGFGNLLFQISAANKFSNDFNSRIVVFDESKTKNQILKKFLNFNYPDASNTELFYAAKEIKNDNLIFRLTKRLMRKLGLHFAKYFHGGHFEPLNYTDDEDMTYQIPDESEPYNIGLLNSYLKSLMKKHLNESEYEVLRLSYGLDCNKHSAKDIAPQININGASGYVRVSELKKQAVQKLIDSVDHSQVIEYL